MEVTKMSEMDTEPDEGQMDASSDLGSEAKSDMDVESASQSSKESKTDTESDSGISEEFERFSAFERRFPRELQKMLEEEGVPRKVMRRLMFMGPPVDMMDMMEMEDKIRRMSHHPRHDMEMGRKIQRMNHPKHTGPDDEANRAGFMGRHRGKEVPQTQPLHARQVRNNASGYVFKVDDLVRFRRYLILGSESGSYYTEKKELTDQNFAVVQRLLAAGKGVDVVNEVVKMSRGRSAKQDQLIVVLSTCARQSEDLSTKRAAYKSLSDVCGIPTHLFMFIEKCQKLSEDSSAGKKGTGWGRAHRMGVANWYLNYKEKPMKLAMQVTKYKQRNGWSHRDVLKLSHPKVDSERGSKALAAIFKYLVKGLDETKEAFPQAEAAADVKEVLEYLQATEHIRTLTVAQEEEVCALIEKHNLVREHLPTEMLNSVRIWKTLLKKMPLMALIRNLGKLSNLKIITKSSTDSNLVVEKLSNAEALKYAKVHPFKLLLARDQYSKGHGDRGSQTWDVNPDITRGLEAAFYKSFKYVEPTNKRFLIALDISASMDSNKIMGTNISSTEASAAMAMLTVRTEKHCDIMAFAHNFIPLNITPDMTLDQVRQKMKQHHFGGTDCALPLTWATNNYSFYDAIIVYTDSETWSGPVHVKAALEKYRQVCDNPEVKVIIVAMVSNGFTIADPEDKHMLDIVGFDTDAPEIIQNFVLGNI